ncbi:MAG: S-layer homology domain-containing protein [Candidatus Heteroscillospira sp.]
MKRRLIISLALALALLGGVGYGLAASAGSEGDPFISLSFLRGDYAENVLNQAESKTEGLDKLYEQASAGLDGGDTGQFTGVNMRAGGELRLDFGGSVLVESGTATLSVEQGEVIDLTEGAVFSGKVQTGHRYLAAEGASAVLRFQTAGSVLYDGDVEVLSGQDTDNPFTDVLPGHWFYADVLSAVRMGLLNGMTQTSFEPEGTITAAQVIKLAACTHQRYYSGEVTLENGSPWYQSYVDYALENGIISSEPEDYNAPCSRSYYIAVMYGAMSRDEYGEINSIPDGAVPDVQPGHGDYDAIYAFYRAGIVTGNDSAGTFAPESNVKRSEVATLVARMFDADVRRSFTLN